MSTLEDWLAAAAAQLGVTTPVDRDAVLALTRDVAHEVARPAAPLTAYLLGVAAGRDGMDADAVRAAASALSARATSWGAQQT